MSDTPKSDDVTLDPETLERLRAELESLHALVSQGYEWITGPVRDAGVRRLLDPETLRRLLDAAERLPQVEAERERFKEDLAAERRAREIAEDAHAATFAHVLSLRAKLDKVWEIAARSYFSAECRAAMSEVLEVLGDS